MTPSFAHRAAATVEAARRFLVDALGFAEAVVVRDEVGDVVHAELAWPGGGTVLLGGTKHVGGVHSGLRAGAVYLVADDPGGVDAVHARVVAAGGEVVAAPHATEFAAGGPTYACSVRDPEGNLWTVGTYRGGGSSSGIGSGSVEGFGSSSGSRPADQAR